MARPTTKNDLMTDAKTNYEKLYSLISKMTEEELNTPLIFQMMKRKKKPIGEEIRI